MSERNVIGLYNHMLLDGNKEKRNEVISDSVTTLVDKPIIFFVLIYRYEVYPKHKDFTW